MSSEALPQSNESMSFFSSKGEKMQFSPREAHALPFKWLAGWVRDIQIDPSALDNLKLAFANGASPNARTSELGQNLLSYACSRGAWSAAIFLLDAGASPLPFSGDSPLPQPPSVLLSVSGSAGTAGGQPGTPLAEADFSPRNHPLLAALSFLKASQDMRHSQWNAKNAPASEAAKILDPDFEAFLDRWLEAGGELTPEKASSTALREVFSMPVFSMAHAFITRNLRLDHLEQSGFYPLVALARSRGARAIGRPRESYLSERPALRQCIANLGAKLIAWGADCTALLSNPGQAHQSDEPVEEAFSRLKNPASKGGAQNASPQGLSELFSGPDAQRIPGFDAYVRERLLSEYESRELLFHMRQEHYRYSLFEAPSHEKALTPPRKTSPRI